MVRKSKSKSKSKSKKRPVRKAKKSTQYTASQIACMDSSERPGVAAAKARHRRSRDPVLWSFRPTSSGVRVRVAYPK